MRALTGGGEHVDGLAEGLPDLDVQLHRLDRGEGAVGGGGVGGGGARLIISKTSTQERSTMNMMRCVSEGRLLLVVVVVEGEEARELSEGVV